MATAIHKQFSTGCMKVVQLVPREGYFMKIPQKKMLKYQEPVSYHK